MAEAYFVRRTEKLKAETVAAEQVRDSMIAHDNVEDILLWALHTQQFWHQVVLMRHLWRDVRGRSPTGKRSEEVLEGVMRGLDEDLSVLNQEAQKRLEEVAGYTVPALWGKVDGGEEGGENFPAAKADNGGARPSGDFDRDTVKDCAKAGVGRRSERPS